MLPLVERLKKIFPQDKVESKQIAKDRLQLVLSNDRMSVSNNFLERFKDDIKRAVLEYIEINDMDIDVRIENIEENGVVVPKIVANIPIKEVKKR